MEIRDASINDALSIKELIYQLGYEISQEDVEKNIDVYKKVNGAVLVAVANNSVIGFISSAYIPLFHSYELMCRITALCVNKKYRTQGTGKCLVQAVEARGKENGCFYIEVTSGAQRSEDAHPFYQRLGYRIYDGKRFRKQIDS